MFYLENGGAREDGVHDNEEGDDDDPVELVEQSEVGSPLKS